MPKKKDKKGERRRGGINPNKERKEEGIALEVKAA